MTILEGAQSGSSHLHLPNKIVSVSQPESGHSSGEGGAVSKISGGVDGGRQHLLFIS